MRHLETKLGKNYSCLTHASMLQITNNVVGWATRDTMICNLPEHGKTQPNHPDPVGLPLDYMVKCKVFDCIWSNLYGLCTFYALGMTGDPPYFPSPQELVTRSQVRDLLKLARSVGHPYVILAHSTNSVTAMSMLQELYTTACLRHLQVDLRDKSIKFDVVLHKLQKKTVNITISAKSRNALHRLAKHRHGMCTI